MISSQDVYWLAGIFEGEGYFGLLTDSGRPVVSVSMTDKDIIDRVASILKFGIVKKERPLPSGKTAYGWSVQKQQDAAGLMMTLFPLMGKRRQSKITKCLNAWKDTPVQRSQWTHCSHGHPLSGDNLRIITEGKYAKRRCNECVRNRQKQYRIKQGRAA